MREAQSVMAGEVTAAEAQSRWTYSRSRERWILASFYFSPEPQPMGWSAHSYGAESLPQKLSHRHAPRLLPRGSTSCQLQHETLKCTVEEACFLPGKDPKMADGPEKHRGA